MKILYITDIDFSSKDAPPIHVKEIINNLSEFKNELFLIGPKIGKLKVKAKTKYIRITKIKILKAILFNLNLFFILPFYIKKNKINVIYARQGISLIVPAIISRIFSIPYITELNGTIIEQLKMDKSNRFVIKIAELIERFSYKNATRIITASKELKEYIIKKYNISTEKIVYIENGVDVDNFIPSNKIKCRKKLNINPRGIYGGYVGGLQKWQGVDYIIRSTKEVIKNIPDYKLIIVGDGPELDNLKNLTKFLNLKGNIIFKGKIDHEKIPTYINAFDVSFCYLTRVNEGNYGTPFKVYEYLSCGVPVILSDIRGITNLFNNQVIIAKPENSQDLSKKIICLLRDKKLRNNLSKQGREFILKGHSWRNVAKRTLNIIKDVVRR